MPKPTKTKHVAEILPTSQILMQLIIDKCAGVYGGIAHAVTVVPLLHMLTLFVSEVQTDQVFPDEVKKQHTFPDSLEQAKQRVRG